MTQEALTKRIEEYLSAGGLFNPELANHVAVRDLLIECREALRENAMREVQRLGQEIEQEPVAHPVIAGALFDFMGWLTSRKERIVLSSADNASPAADAIRDFANMRGLSLDDAKVQDWNTTPPQRTWVGLTDEEKKDLCRWWSSPMDAIYATEAKLKEKNT